jgi:hypothetical protein
VAMEEAQEAPDVVVGMFLINDTSAVVLFDSRASHSFISTAYVGKHNLALAPRVSSNKGELNFLRGEKHFNFKNPF